MVDMPNLTIRKLEKQQYSCYRKYHKDEQKIPTGFQKYSEEIGVAGIQHRRDAATKFVNSANQWLEFEPEPLNKFDSNAIKVLGCCKLENEISKIHVGYVPALMAKQIKKSLIEEFRPRLYKTYIGESGYVEIEFQLLGPKGRFEEYMSFYEYLPQDDEEDEEADDDS